MPWYANSEIGLQNIVIISKYSTPISLLLHTQLCLLFPSVQCSLIMTCCGIWTIIIFTFPPHSPLPPPLLPFLFSPPLPFPPLSHFPLLSPLSSLSSPLLPLHPLSSAFLSFLPSLPIHSLSAPQLSPCFAT